MALTKEDLESFGAMMNVRFDLMDKRFDSKLKRVVDQIAEVNKEMLNEINKKYDDHEGRITSLERWRKA